MRALAQLGWVFAACLPLAAASADDATPPLETGLTADVEVKLVTIDVVAVDSEGRTIADLTKDDFRLYVNGKETPVDTLDVFCDGGATDDPVAKRIGAWPTPTNLDNGLRRVVLAFDYLHGGGVLTVQALQQYREVLESKPEISDEEIMVVAMTNGVRIEQPFTRDRRAVVEALRRMEHDITLWNGNFSHLTDYPWFSGLNALVTVLAGVPGPKAVVFVSAGPGPENTYEPDFRKLAARAGNSQVSFYTVDSRGLGGGVPRVWERSGGPFPRGLARLASVTGGGLSQGVNDLTIGYARARRDLGCRYTMGFYDHKPEEDTQHSLRVEFVRRGIFLHYADRYSFPSAAERRFQSVQAAYLAPQMFEEGGMRVQVFPSEPVNEDHWNALIAVDFELPASVAEDAATREFGVVLTHLIRSTYEVTHTFHRTLTLTGSGASRQRRVTFLEPVVLKPGRYEVHAVLADPASEKPFAAVAEVVMPDIPRWRPFLVGPILGRRSGDDVTVFGGASDRVGSETDFRPVLAGETQPNTPLAALTQACIVQPSLWNGPWIVERSLISDSSEVVATMPAIELAREGKSRVVCQKVFDELPIGTLPLGNYTYQATLGTVDAKPVEDGTKRVAIALVDGPEATAP